MNLNNEIIMSFGISKLLNFSLFKNFGSRTRIEFKKLTLIHGTNARGKTALATLLHSAGTNKPSLLTGRRKLGAKYPLEIGLSIDDSQKISFLKGEWLKAIPDIVVFGDRFIAENVSAGLTVSKLQRYNILELVIGEAAVKLNQQLKECAAELKSFDKQFLEFDNLIPMDVRPGLTVEEFVNVSSEVESDKPNSIDVSAIGSSDSDALSSHISQQVAIRNRRRVKYSNLCTRYLKTISDKHNTQKKMEEIRQQIMELKQQVLPKYFKKMNSILKGICANFKIVATKDKESSQANYIDYNLQFNNHDIPIEASEGEHQFENTLSAGDRNSLALAFFIAKLEIDGNLKDKIIVFDDPIASLDTSRVHFLQNTIARLGPKVKAIVVFSHSKPYLRGIYRVCRKVQEKIGYELIRSTNNETIFREWDIKRDLTSDFNRRLNRVKNYVKDGSSEEPNHVAFDLRMVLEGYCQVYFGREFADSKQLGKFLNKLNRKNYKSSVPISQFKVELLIDLVDYANPFHHFERDTIDGTDVAEDELTLNAQKLLVFMNLLDESKVT